MRLHMTDDEILRSYRDAKNRNEQVCILADLNAITVKEMAEYLAEHGEKVDGRLLAGKRVKKSAKRKAEEAEAVIRNLDLAVRNEAEETSDEVKEVVKDPEPVQTQEPEAEENFCEREENLAITKIKVYIAGPITDNPHYREQFAEVEKWLTEIGFEAVNPTNNCCADYKGYIDAGLRQLADCDMICLIPGWSDSRGASLEKQYADVIEIPEILIPDRTWGDMAHAAMYDYAEEDLA